MRRSWNPSRIGAWFTLALALFAGAASLAVFARSAHAADQPVAMQNIAFTPPSVTVNVGDMVTWTNGDTVPHTATANNGSFDTGNVAPGGTASATFSTAGTFAYTCTIHPQMTGTVTVQAVAGASPAAGGTAAAPATGSGTYAARDESWAPLAVLGGGLVAALALGSSVLLFRHSRA